jgi:tetratricopeptide (TPR) repeat protein
MHLSVCAWTMAILLCLATGSTVGAQNLGPLYTLYKDGQYGALLAQTGALLKEHPENAELNQLHGRGLLDAGKPREAIPALERAIALDADGSWISSWSLAYLGRARFICDNYEGAKQALKKCVTLNLAPSATLAAQKMRFAFGMSEHFETWTRVETVHFRFVLQTPITTEEAKAFAEQHEDAYVKICEALEVKNLSKKIDFIVWENRREPMLKFQISLGQADPDNAIVYCSRDCTIGREITQVVASLLRGSRANKPVGLIYQGLANHFDQTNRDQKALARSFVERHNITKLSITDVWLHWNKYPEEFSQPLAGAFVAELINRFGMHKFRLLMADQSLDNARLIYGAQLDIMISEFESSLVGKVI